MGGRRFGKALTLMFTFGAGTNADAAVAEAEAARLVYQRDLNLVAQGIVARQEMAEAGRGGHEPADPLAAQLILAGWLDAGGEP